MRWGRRRPAPSQALETPSVFPLDIIESLADERPLGDQ
jgi:hypothetical protein